LGEQKKEEKEKPKVAIRFSEPKIMVREWKLGVEPGEWREATEEEVRELVEEPWIKICVSLERLRRFWRKMEEATRELFG